MRYKTVWDYELPKLDAKVNAAMEAGWVPQGSICVARLLGVPTAFYQSMVLHETKPEGEVS